MALVQELIHLGDRTHALHHCLGALGREPEHTAWQAPLRELLADASLANQLATDNFFGAQAARAFQLHDSGQLGEAIDIIADVHRAMPHLGFQRWLGRWAAEALAEGATINPAPLLRVLVLGSSFGIGRMRLLPAEQSAAEELVPIARLALAALPAEPTVAIVASSVLRRAGRFAEAVVAAEGAQSFSTRSSYLTIKALALRGNRDFDAAIAAFADAFAESNDRVHLIETVRVLADAGRWTEALAAWEKFAAIGSPEEENWMAHALIQRLAQSNAGPPAVPPLDQVRRLSLGHGSLHQMSDATANTLRQIGEDQGLRTKGPHGAGAAIRSGKINMAVSGYEAPSNRLCLALMLAGEPDPRLASYESPGELPEFSHDGEEYPLWIRQENVAVPALPAPPGNVSDWVEKVALCEPDGSVADGEFATSTNFLDMWESAASAPPPAATARDWVAATVYPRMPVIRVCTGPDWVYRWQVAALTGLAHSEPGWADTQKRAALLSLLGGVADWPLAAAIRVATELALREPAAMKELRQTLIDLTYRLSGEQNGAITLTLFDALTMLPYVPKEYVDRLHAQINSAADSPTPAASPPAPAAKPAKRPWWKFWG